MEILRNIFLYGLIVFVTILMLLVYRFIRYFKIMRILKEADSDLVNDKETKSAFIKTFFACIYLGGAILVGFIGALLNKETKIGSAFDLLFIYSLTTGFVSIPAYFIFGFYKLKGASGDNAGLFP